MYFGRNEDIDQSSCFIWSVKLLENTFGVKKRYRFHDFRLYIQSKNWFATKTISKFLSFVFNEENKWSANIGDISFRVNSVNIFRIIDNCLFNPLWKGTFCPKVSTLRSLRPRWVVYLLTLDFPNNIQNSFFICQLIITLARSSELK